jgi:phage shock protein E
LTIFNKLLTLKFYVIKKYLFFGLVGFALIASGYLFWQSRPQADNVGAVKGAKIVAETYIDVRTDQEWQQGHLDGAMHFDLALLQQGQLPGLPKDTPIALYCRTGVRAGQALQILQQNGFTNARNAGGFAALQAQGNKVCLGIEPSCN